jgi:hypothetical protein
MTERTDVWRSVQHQFSQWYYIDYCYTSPNISSLSDITMLSSITSAPLLLHFAQHRFAQWYYIDYCYTSPNISSLSGITMLSSITSAPLLLQFVKHQFAQWYYNVVLYHIRSLTVTVRPTSVCSVVLQCCPLLHPRLYCYSSSNISLFSDITIFCDRGQHCNTTEQTDVGWTVTVKARMW